jgi:hypothetical protein
MSIENQFFRILRSIAVPLESYPRFKWNRYRGCVVSEFDENEAVCGL